MPQPPPRGTDGRVRRNRSCRGSVGGRHAVAIGGRAGAAVVGLGPGNARPAAPAAETRTCGAATIGGALAGAGCAGRNDHQAPGVGACGAAAARDVRSRWPQRPAGRTDGHGVACGPRSWEVKAAVGRGPVAVGGLSPEPRVVRCMVGQALLAMPWALPVLDSHFSSVEV